METQRRIMCNLCNGHGRFYYAGHYKDAKDCLRCLGLKIVLEITSVTYKPISENELPLRKEYTGL